MAMEPTIEKPGNLVIVGIPSKNGVYSDSFLASRCSLQTPFNTTLGNISVVGKPVDEARNMIVKKAKELGARYLFFMDDDVIIPHFAIPRLLNLKVMVASGVYPSKTIPPAPIILKDGHVGGYDDWAYGDVIEVDYVGCGCLLIDMRIFDKISEPYFKYVQGPTEPSAPIITMGEDVWFCEKAKKEAGEKIWVDTMVQCAHEDFARKVLYYFLPKINKYVWKPSNGPVQALPSANDPDRQKPYLGAVSGSKLSLGYETIEDGYTDIKTVSLEELRKRFKGVTAIKMQTTLEYINHDEAVKLLLEFRTLMADNATIEIKVPNVVKYLSAITDDTGLAQFELMYGGWGTRYKSAYTFKTLGELMSFIGFKEIKISEQENDLVVVGNK